MQNIHINEIKAKFLRSHEAYNFLTYDACVFLPPAD